MAQNNKNETRDLRNKILENLSKIVLNTKNVEWANYKKAFNSMDDYLWIRISPIIHYAQPMGFSTREKENGRKGAYQIYVNPNIPKQFQVPIEMHEWGHILYTHLSLLSSQNKILISKIRSYWPEIKLHLSDEVLNRATNDKEYGDYICNRLCNCILNIAMDFEVNSKLFQESEKDDLIQYLSIAGCYSLAYANESSVGALERALRWTEYQLGIRKPKEGNKVAPLFMPCLPEDLGLPRGLEFEKYIDYMIIHDDEFFQYARNTLSKSTGLSGSPNPPQNQLKQDSGDEIDDTDEKPSNIGDSSDYGKEESPNDLQQSGQGGESGSNKPSLPELATEKHDHQIDEDGGGMEDWNPSNDEKNAQQQQQQNSQGSNGNSQGSNNQQGNSSSQQNSNQQDSSDTQDGQNGNQQDMKSDNQSASGNDTNESNQGLGNETSEKDSTNESNQDGNISNTDSLGRPIDESHIDEDEMDANSTAPASSDMYDNLNNSDDSNQDNNGSDTSGNNSNKDKGNNSDTGDSKLSPEQIENLIKSYDDSNLESNQEKLDAAEKEIDNQSQGEQGSYSPLGHSSATRSGNNNSERNDIISIKRTDKLEKIIIQRCFNKQHMDTRVDSMYYYNRRKFNSNRIITKKRTEDRYKPGNIYILVDVSGSVNELAVNSIIHTVKKVASKCGKNSRVIFWDTELCGDYPLNKIDEIPCGGGTRMATGIEYIREHYLRRTNDKLIVVSDFFDRLDEWVAEIKKLKGDASGICWSYDLDENQNTSIKEYLQDNCYDSRYYSSIDELLRKMPSVIVSIKN